MKAMLAGFTAAILIAIGAWYGLNHAGFSSQAVYSSPNVRLE
ncbi:hypothetical protein [Tropicimonas isoalkanivorans]|jgi:hypothetical protein|uniref:Uncharacterized protein n=1 Tax=Tropicimonas isoalkanivorans TaxID=441112 RepID=A0A1I1DAG6_9RHOB|nr:hypothetical protein [Tropicimonas isoalkanivorans]SFB71931.1 hypothetical protein SAMN04488094_101102 [Tropicimonas isoalkanivorans]